MRFLIRFLFGLIAFVAFLGILGSGILWGYAEYGIPFVNEQILAIEDGVETELESQYPGTTVLVNVGDILYKQEASTVKVVLQVHAQVLLIGVLQDEVTLYVEFDVMDITSSNPTFNSYEEGTEWDAVSANYELVPEMVFNQTEMNNVAIQALFITASTFVIALIVRRVFKKKR